MNLRLFFYRTLPAFNWSEKLLYGKWSNSEVKKPPRRWEKSLRMTSCRPRLTFANLSSNTNKNWRWLHHTYKKLGFLSWLHTNILRSEEHLTLTKFLHWITYHAYMWLLSPNFVCVFNALSHIRREFIHDHVFFTYSIDPLGLLVSTFFYSPRY